MRNHSQLEWEILDGDAEDWGETGMLAEPGATMTRNRLRPANVLGAVALVIILAGIIGYQLWQTAEAGIAATEHHIGTLVEVETLRQQARSHGSGPAVGVESIALTGEVAIVHVTVSDTTPLGQIVPYVEIRFYCHTSAGWQRTEPTLADWGSRALLDMTTVRFDFYELDRPDVEAIAAPLDDFHRTLRALLRLPEASSALPIAVTITPRLAGSTEDLPDSPVVAVSPLLLRRAVGTDGATMLSTAVRRQLIAHAIAESEIHYGVRSEWRSMLDYLAGWIATHADDLAAIEPSAAPQRQGHHEPSAAPSSAMLGMLMADNRADYASPGNAGYRSESTAQAANAFFDYLLAERGAAALPALLAAFGVADDWAAVLDILAQP